MAQEEVNKSELSDDEIRQMVAESDTGGRRPTGLSAKIVIYAAMAWSLFQMWIASPLPFAFGVFVLNDTQSRSIHLAFAMFLGYLLFPPLRVRRVRESDPGLDSGAGRGVLRCLPLPFTPSLPRVRASRPLST